jgi:hypothetical protein
MRVDDLHSDLRKDSNTFVFLVWFALTILFSAMWMVGISPAADFDDLLKLHQLRVSPLIGGWFDRTIPGILQPEPFLSHWSSLGDIPYALVIGPLEWIIGRDAAVDISAFSVPIFLLLPALYFFRRIIVSLEFRNPDKAFVLAVPFALGTFFEFIPGRVDYHNIGIVLLLASVALSLETTRSFAAATAGVAMAICLAMSIELVAFFALVMGIYAVGFVSGDAGSARRMRDFGMALALASALLFFAISPGEGNWVVRCDAYSLPHSMALSRGGASFVLAGAAASRIEGVVRRSIFIAACGIVSLLCLAGFFPQCADGPYASLSEYVREHWLSSIAQEQSMLSRREILAGAIGSLVLVAVGTSALLTTAISDRFRTRSLAAVAVFAVVALVQAFVYSRYFRYAPLFAAPGLLLAMISLVPARSFLSQALTGRVSLRVPSAARTLVPGLMIAFATAAAVYFTPAEAQVRPATLATEFAGRCSIAGIDPLEWPKGSVVLAPPALGIQLLGTDPVMSVTAITNHPSWRGIERSYRFFDPATSDRRHQLDLSKATHLVLCAGSAGSAPGIFEFVAALAASQPPPWLSLCPVAARSPLVVYRYPSAGGAASACPQ